MIALIRFSDPGGYTLEQYLLEVSRVVTRALSEGVVDEDSDIVDASRSKIVEERDRGHSLFKQSSNINTFKCDSPYETHYVRLNVSGGRLLAQGLNKNEEERSTVALTSGDLLGTTLDIICYSDEDQMVISARGSEFGLGSLFWVFHRPVSKLYSELDSDLEKNCFLLSNMTVKTESHVNFYNKEILEVDIVNPVTPWGKIQNLPSSGFTGKTGESTYLLNEIGLSDESEGYYEPGITKVTGIYLLTRDPSSEMFGEIIDLEEYQERYIVVGGSGYSMAVPYG